MKYITLIILIINTLTMSAQTLPKQVDLQELGLKFEIPDGWSGQPGDESILLGHQSIPGMMILTLSESKDATTLKSLAEKGIHDQGVDLKPTGDFKLKGNNRVEGMYEGTFDGTMVKVYAIGLINGYGNGMNIYVLTEPEKFTNQHKSEANKLATSVQFYQAQDSEATAFWKNKLIGKQIKYLSSSYDTDYSGGSTSSSTTNTIYLYEDGTCYYYYNSFASFDAGDADKGDIDDSSDGFGYANSRDQNEGNFLIYTDLEGSYLELTMQDGKVFEYKLERNEKGHTLLNGTRYFVTTPE